MSFEIKAATRQGIIPLLGLWGGTGSGKTHSALLIARGIAGPKARVVIIDTEGGRARYYSDIIPGGYERIDFDAPYSPERYCEALSVLEKGADVGVIDSASHAWEGPDGCLDLHEQALDRMLKDRKDDWGERQRMNWPAWREPKFRFAQMRSKILALRIPLIICFRGKIKSRMGKDDKGRNTVITDSNTTPIFDDSFIFEMHVAVECFQRDGRGGFIRFPMPYAKTSHRDIRALLPKEETEQLTLEHGAALAKWCSTPSGPGTHDPKRELMLELWNLAKSVRGPKVADQKQAWQAFEIWAVGQDIIQDTEEVPAMTPDRLREVIQKTKEKLPK